ncbi:MAG: helix-hairpin-helix domain-containing protein, partial [Anaerolineales bacterium]|nr:helix-hairpin-helix domain-containing protein [Anaerolineales bacterium]
MSENILVDPNTADEETLAQIPGVGEEIAKRILNARPYASLDDLQRVNGIGPVFLENILPYLALSPDDTESVGEDE